MANKFCSNCKYYELFNDEEPCLTCDGDNGRHINWRPSGSGDPEPDALDAARRAGRAEGLREAAEILRTAAAADARNAAYCSAPNHRERLQKLSENELVMAQRMLARAEEVDHA